MFYIIKHFYIWDSYILNIFQFILKQCKNSILIYFLKETKSEVIIFQPFLIIMKHGNKCIWLIVTGIFTKYNPEQTMWNHAFLLKWNASEKKLKFRNPSFSCEWWVHPSLSWSAQCSFEHVRVKPSQNRESLWKQKEKMSELAHWSLRKTREKDCIMFQNKICELL